MTTENNTETNKTETYVHKINLMNNINQTNQPNNNPTTKKPYRPFKIYSSESSNISKTACNCKNSKCLKFYYECFSGFQLCNPAICLCIDCENTIVKPERQQITLMNYLDKNKYKLKSSLGCNCQKSNCLKKYCECRARGEECVDYCKCCEW